MLYCTKDQKEEYQGIEEHLSFVNQVINDTNWSDLTNGSYRLSKTVQLNVFNYSTKTRQEATWEAHRKHIDVHCVISGREWVDLTTETLVEKKYDESDDGALLEGQETYGVWLTAADYLVLFPDEAHRTGICDTESQEMRKAVFKIKVEG